MNRTIVSASDTLTFTNDGEECWALYRGWRFRITGGDQGRKSWRTWFIDAEGDEVWWYWAGRRVGNPYTTNFQGRSMRRIIKKAMRYIDEKVAEQERLDTHWPNC